MLILSTWFRNVKRSYVLRLICTRVHNLTFMKLKRPNGYFIFGCRKISNRLHVQGIGLNEGIRIIAIKVVNLVVSNCDYPDSHRALAPSIRYSLH